MIAQCLSYSSYKAVYITADQYTAISGFLRMRSDHKSAPEKIKSKILPFALRNGLRYTANNWMQLRIQFLRYCQCDPIVREILNDYLWAYAYLNNRIEEMNQRIHMFYQDKAYCEKVKKLQCMIGIKEHTALALISEIGDFTGLIRAILLVPILVYHRGQFRSAKTVLTGIPKAGNGHCKNSDRKCTGDLRGFFLDKNPNVIKLAEKTANLTDE